MTPRMRALAMSMGALGIGLVVVGSAVVLGVLAADAPPPNIAVTLTTGVRVPCWTLTVDMAPGADPEVLCAYKAKDGAAGYLFHGWSLAQVRTIEARAR